MRILLIEDDEDVAGVVVAGMRAAHHEITHALDGREGMAQALRQRFDVMIFDRQLPGGVDGADLLRDLRANRVETPALFLSGTAGLGAWMDGLDSGADDYLAKPFSLAELIHHVEALRRPD